MEFILSPHWRLGGVQVRQACAFLTPPEGCCPTFADSPWLYWVLNVIRGIFINAWCPSGLSLCPQWGSLLAAVAEVGKAGLNPDWHREELRCAALHSTAGARGGFDLVQYGPDVMCGLLLCLVTPACGSDVLPFPCQQAWSRSPWVLVFLGD